MSEEQSFWRDGMTTEMNGPIYQLKVTLVGIDPPVWRRIQLYRHKSFYDLHLTLQAAMGWLNYHLHQFKVAGLTITDEETLEEWADWVENLRSVDHHEARLMDYVREVGTAFTYEYDFGDSWEHQLVLEKVLPVEPGAHYPRCLDGARATPPEDVGGIWGYVHFLEAIRDPEDPEHEEYLYWVGGTFDPEAFDSRTVNRRFREGYRWGKEWVTPPLATRPHFTAPAREHWEQVPEEAKVQILAAVWCAHCRRPTTIVDYAGRVQKGDLLVEGHCAVCGGRVARLLEGS
jgi:hypothetical protein